MASKATAEEPIIDRVMRRVAGDPRTGCWLWTGSLQPTGYARITVGGNGLFVHRWMFERFRGAIPDGFTVDHACHNADPTCPGGRCTHRRCVRPEHLEAVHRGLNVLRGKTLTAANVAKTACPRGHAYTGLVTQRGRRPTRICRTCKNAQQRAYMARKAVG